MATDVLPQWKITRRIAVLLAVLGALTVGLLAYVAHYGQCDTGSHFCAVGIAGTRSEVVVGWLDRFEVFTQTYPEV